jgi:hypothetical protein
MPSDISSWPAADFQSCRCNSCSLSNSEITNWIVSARLDFPIKMIMSSKGGSLNKQIPSAKMPFPKKQLHKNLLPLKPVEITDAEREMFRREDYVELEYFQCDLIRRRKRKTPEQLKRLAEHDAEHKLIHRDPTKAMRKAHQSLDLGSSLLLKLIRFGKLTHRFEPTEQGKAAGIKAESHSDAFMCLASRISYLNSQLIRLAEDNAPGACRSLWFQAKALTEGFVRLATVHPEEFREVAEDSLTMPSLRARSSKFTADADTIIAAIHLAEKHPTPNVWDNKSRVGALCHLVVVSIIEKIRFERRQYEWEKEHLRLAKKFHEEEYRDATVEDVLRSRWHPKVVRTFSRLLPYRHGEMTQPHGGKAGCCLWLKKIFTTCPRIHLAIRHFGRN